MKLKLFFSLTILSFFYNTMNAQSNSELAITDQDQLIKLCLELPALQEKIPTDLKTMISVNYIFDNGVGLNITEDLHANGKKIILKSESNPNISRIYYSVYTLKIEANKAFAKYYFVSSQNDVRLSIPVNVEFEKINSLWLVTNQNFKY